MYGWRAKIGLMIPANNTVIEPELVRFLPDGVSLHATRMVVDGVFEPQALMRLEQNATRAMGELSQSQVDVQVYACMSTSLVKGRKWDEEFRAQQKTPNCPAALCTAAAATMEALQALGGRKVTVLSPYPPTIHPLIAPYFMSYGIEVAVGANLEIADLTAVNNVDPNQIYRRVRELARSGAEAVCLLATDMPTFPAIEHLERDLGIPVVSTNQAILWWSLRAAGVFEPLSGLGRLLASGSAGATAAIS